MVKIHNNNRGIALVTSIVLTLIALIVIMGILYMVTQSTKSSGLRKVYKNAVEASYGGAELTMLEVIPKIIDALPPMMYDSSTGNLLAPENLIPSGALSSVESNLSVVDMTFLTSASSSNRNRCIADKLSKPPGENWVNWTNCPTNNINPRSFPDFRFTLKGVESNYMVYTKIVDTTPGTPYPLQFAGSDQLLGGGVTDVGGAALAPGKHFLFRIEVASEREKGTGEQGRLTVVYEY